MDQPELNLGMIGSECEILPVGKRRDGGTRFWCVAHKADATLKYGKPSPKCRYADVPPILDEETLEIRVHDYPGGVALWGAVPPIFDTTRQSLDKGIHVHARRSSDGEKVIDRTYRRVRVADGDETVQVSDLDAIYFMVSSVFGFGTKFIECTRCGHPHLDKDWFSVHPHQSHLCAGCGRNFRDRELAIGNPVAAIQGTQSAYPGLSQPSIRDLKICQADYEGGIQIWGSNPAILWTSTSAQETGIHIHAFQDDQSKPAIDDTFRSVEIDGISLNEAQVRTYMAQGALPHLAGRVQVLDCINCGAEHFDEGMYSIEPRVSRECIRCKAGIRAKGRLKKVVANPIIRTLAELSKFSLRQRQFHDIGLLPETI